MNDKIIRTLNADVFSMTHHLFGAGMALTCLALISNQSAAHPGHNQNPQRAMSQTEVPPPGESKVTIQIRGDYRHIDANGLPNHDTGHFPGPGNPNAIATQNYHFRVPITPEARDKPLPYERQPFGIALNGVLFDPFTAEFWKKDPNSGWREAADPNHGSLGIDANHAHVQPNGAYHYHGVPVPLVTDTTRMTLIGWAADGFPIYGPYGHKDADRTNGEIVLLQSSYQLRPGDRPVGAPPGAYDGTYDQDYEYVAGSGDLDACNGRTGPTPEFPEGTYYYVVTNDYPYVPRLFRGEPDPSFDLRGHNGPPNRPRRNRPGPPNRGAR